MDKKIFIEMKDGTKIYCRRIGAGEPLIFLHGNGSNSRFFVKQVETLKEHFSLYFIDSRSHGHSDNNTDYLSFEQMSGDLLEVLDYFKLDKVNILGFSDGANLAMVFAKEHPERINSLILNAGNIKFSGTKLISQILSYLQYYFSFILYKFFDAFKNFYLVSSLLVRDLNISEEELRNFKFPCLILVGSRDLIKSCHSRYISKLIENSKFVEVKGHGHSLARTNHRYYNEIIINFLKENHEKIY